MKSFIFWRITFDFIQADIVPIYGARDKWNGLGIILDSFDNNSKGDNPIIMMHVNDGTKNYNHNEVISCCPFRFFY